MTDNAILTAQAYFLEALEAPLPTGLIDAPLLPVRAPGCDAWSKHPERIIHGYPHYLDEDGSPDQLIIAHGGYGVNSYAVYFTRVLPNVQVYLRIPFGGAYMQPSKFYADAVLHELAAVGELIALATSRGAVLKLTDNMRSLKISLRRKGDRARVHLPMPLNNRGALNWTATVKAACEALVPGGSYAN